MPELGEAMEKYIYGYLKSLRRRAPSTIIGAEHAIGRFVEWMTCEHPGVLTTEDLTADHFGDFLTSHWGHLADRSFNLYVGYLRRWIRFMGDEGWLTPGSNVARKVIEREKPLPAKPQQFIREQSAYDLADAAGRWCERDKYYIRLSYGLRRRFVEISGMRVGDINLTPQPHRPFGTFTFNDQKTRSGAVTLPLTEQAAKDVREWLKIYEENLHEHIGPKRDLRPTDFLIPAIRPGKGVKTLKGHRRPVAMNPTQRLPYQSAWQLLARAQELAGSSVAIKDGKPKTHGLRRGGIDDLIAATGDIRMGQAMAHHSTQTTTEIYTDRRRQVDDLGDALGQLAGKAATQTQEAEASNVVSLADRLARRSGA